jgi:AcrR family transcriptional regulator
MFFKMTKNQIERKLKILKAAIASFANSGFHLSDIGAIARTAGVGKGAIYRYFSSKEELFFESVKFCTDEMYDFISAKLENTDLDQFVETLFDAHKDYYSEHKETYLFVTKAIIEMPERMVSLFHTIHAQKMQNICRKLEENAEKGKIRQEIDTKVLVKMIDVVSNLFFLTDEISPEADNYEDVKRTVTTVFNLGIFK